MKPLKYSALLLLLSGLWLTSCEYKDFDAPPHDEPQYTGASTITIKDFKAKYNSDLVEVTGNDVIEGIVTANDESGNLYKQLFIQDETGALMVAINQTSIYNYYPVGQKVFIEAKGLYMGKYGGMQQLGYKYSKNNDANYTIGQVPWDIFKTKIFRHGYVTPESAAAKTISFDEFTADNLGLLVTLEGVSFTDAGQIFSYPASGNNVQTLNRIIYLATNSTKTITGRMSSAADFAADTIPAGVGKLTGILTVFQSGSSTTYQFLIRTKNDINFEANADGWGLQDSPWSVGYAIANQGTSKTGWVKGYIVGTVQPGVNDANPVDANSDIAFEGPFALNNYIVIAASATERDYSKCIVINLPAGSALRTAVNLVDNAANLGKELAVTGSLENLLGTKAVKVATGSSSEFIFGNAGKTLLSAPFTSSLSPFTAVSVKGDQVWAYDSYGYAKITGYVSPSYYENEDWLISPAIDLTDYTAANVSFQHITRYATNATDFTLWASDNYTGGLPSTATWTQITVTGFSSGTAWDDWASSGNLNIPAAFAGKSNVHVALKYISTTSKAGTWEVKNFVVKSGAGDTGTTDPTDPGTGTGDGSSTNPYTVADGITKQNQSVYAWVQGYIVGTVKNGITTITSASDFEFAAPFTGYTNVAIAPTATETDYTKFIIVNLPSGKPLRTQVGLVDNPGNIGKTLKVYGQLRSYFGIAGLRDATGESDSFVLEGGGTTPEPTTDILNVTFMAGMGNFTTQNIAGTAEWTSSTSYGATISGYYNSKSNANEDWLISPAMDLTGKTSATITFQHAINKGLVANMASNHTLWISKNYSAGAPTTATWEQVTIATYPTGADWTYVSSSNISVPASYLGQTNVRIAFKYLCSDSESATWEIKNLVIK